MEESAKVWFGFSVERLKGIFIEGLKSKIRQNVRNYWANNPDVDLAALSRYASSVASIAGPKAHDPSLPNVTDARPRGRKGGHATLAIESEPSSSPTTVREIPDMDTVLEMAGVMMLQSGTTPDDVESFKSSVAMDRSHNCHLCFAFRDHDTSKCPFLDPNKPGFVETRNRNFARYLKARRNAGTGGGRRRGGRRTVQEGQLSGAGTNNVPMTPATQQSQTGQSLPANAAPTGNAQGQV